MAPLSDTDRARLALALVFLRYLGHTAGCTWSSENWRDEVLALATRLGVRAEFVQTLLDTPVSSVTIKDLDGKATPTPAGKRGKFRERRPWTPTSLKRKPTG